MRVDLDQQSLLSCSGAGIEHIRIVNDSIAEVFDVSWSDGRAKAPSVFTFTNIDSRFLIRKGWRAELIGAGEFKLKPSSNYTIERTVPDVSGFNLHITTGITGEIISTDAAICP